MELNESKYYTNPISRHQRLQGRGETRTVVMHRISPCDLLCLLTPYREARLHRKQHHYPVQTDAGSPSETGQPRRYHCPHTASTTTRPNGRRPTSPKRPLCTSRTLQFLSPLLSFRYTRLDLERFDGDLPDVANHENYGALSSATVWAEEARRRAGRHSRARPCALPFCRRGALRLLAAITQAAVITRILRPSRWRPSHLPLPRPVVAKHSARSTKPTPAWAHRRGARRRGGCRPFARGAMPLEIVPPSFSDGPLRGPRIPAALPSPLLRRLSRPCIAALRLATSRLRRAEGAAGAASTQRPPVKAGGGSGGAKMPLVFPTKSQPPSSPWPQLKRRIKLFQLDPCIFGCKAPIDLHRVVVALVLPRRHLVF